MLGIVTGCGNEEINEESNNTKLNVDTEFIKDLEKSTEARWDKTAESDQELNLTWEEELNYLESFVQAEAEIIYKYEEKKFNDPRLEKLAKDYVEGVKLQEKSLDYATRDEFKFYEDWDKGADIRSVALTELVDDYGVNVDENNMKELRRNSQLVEEEKEREKAIDEMLEGIEFKIDSDEYDWKEYVAVVENTTDIEFSSFDLEIKLIDEDDVTIDHHYAYANNWQPGEKVKFSFMTDKSFYEIEWSWKYHTD